MRDAILLQAFPLVPFPSLLLPFQCVSHLPRLWHMVQCLPPSWLLPTALLASPPPCSYAQQLGFSASSALSASSLPMHWVWACAQCWPVEPSDTISSLRGSPAIALVLPAPQDFNQPFRHAVRQLRRCWPEQHQREQCGPHWRQGAWLAWPRRSA